MTATATSDIPLTDRQRQMLRAIHDHAKRFGCYPTLRELMRAMGIKSPNGVMGHVHFLRRKGYIERHKGEINARSLRLVGMRLDVVVEDTDEGRRLQEALSTEGEGA